PAQLPAQAAERPTPLAERLLARRVDFVDQQAVVGRDCLGHASRKLPLLRRRAELADPDGRLAARLDDLVGKPLQLLTVARVQGQRRQHVNQLSRPKKTQRPTERAPRPRRITRQPRTHTQLYTTQYMEMHSLL